MNYLPRLGAGLLALLTLPALAAAENTFRLELNTTESAENRCRASFLVENKSDRQVDSFKVDLVVFGQEHTMQRRMVIELGPVRRDKTIVRTFSIERDCNQIGGFLVNDVTACAPGDPNACLDELVLSSRVPSIRLYK